MLDIPLLSQVKICGGQPRHIPAVVCVCVCVGVRERPLSGEAEWSRMGAGTALSPTVGAFLNDQVLEKHLCTAPCVGVCV